MNLSRPERMPAGTKCRKEVEGPGSHYDSVNVIASVPMKSGRVAIPKLVD